MTQPVPISLAQLVTPASADDCLQLSLTKAQELGLPTTAWQAVQMIPDLIEVNATLAADYSDTVALIAQGGYPSYAALMVDANGQPITEWMSLIAVEFYNVTRFPAGLASGPVPVTNSTGTTYTFNDSNPVRFQNPTTLATFKSAGTGSVVPGNSNVQVVADLAGSGSTSGAGVTLRLTTPLVGVTVRPLADALVGSDEESNAELLLRGQRKTTTLCPISPTDQPSPVPGAAKGTYEYVATTIPAASVASAVPPYAVTARITRAGSTLNTGSGQVDLYIANANGSPSVGDVAAVDAAVQALSVPDAVTVNVHAAAAVFIQIIATVYIKTGGVTTAAADTNIRDALANYFASLPIGGLNTTAPNIVPLAEIQNAILGANTGSTDIVFVSPTSSPAVGVSGVPELDPSSVFTVVFT